MKSKRSTSFAATTFPLTLAAAAAVLSGGVTGLAAQAPGGRSIDATEDRDVMTERARMIHDRVMTLDTHVDIDAGNFGPGEPNYASGLDGTQVDLPSMESGGLDAAFFSIYQAQQGGLTAEGYRRAFDTALDKVLAVRRLTTEIAPGRIGLAVTAADARRIAGEGRLVAFMGMENGYALGEDPENLRRFAELGVRYLSLAHNGNNQLSDSHTGEETGYRWNGLSPLGREVVAEANRRGVMLDVSHPSKAAALEIMELSRAPVIASHSSVRALANHSRNMDDELLRALADGGGVIQVVAFSDYLSAPPPERAPALRVLREEFGLPGGAAARRDALAEMPAERREEYLRREGEIDERWPAPRRATVTDLVDHIDYVVDLVGIDHVGISSDFDGGGGIIGWNDATETFNVTLELVERGYSEEEIARIWSGNLLRVMEETARIAADLQAEAQP